MMYKSKMFYSDKKDELNIQKQWKRKAFNRNFGYTGDGRFVVDVYLNEKGPSVKIQLLNILRIIIL